ncbi:MAG: S8 family serine peptidase [Pseudomonadota bacterium]
MVSLIGISAARRIAAGLGFAAVASLMGCAAMEVGSGDATLRPVLVDDDELVVLFGDEVSAADLNREVTGRGYVVREARPLASLDLNLLTLTIPDGVTGKAAIAEVEGIEPRSTAGINHAFHSPTVIASADPRRYADRMLGWPSNGCRAAAKVGLIDTFVDAADPSLSGVRIISESFGDADATVTRHGTDIAAIIADQRRLQDVSIYNAAVIGGTETGGQAAGVDELVEALDWLAANDVRIVNMSLAGPFNKILARGVNAAAARGMIIVAAVGNDGDGAPPLYPAAYPTVLAVTAVDVEAQVYPRAVQGEHIDVAAPGVDVFVAAGEAGRFSTGTSIAAPFVTARIAADPALAAAPDIEAVREALRSGAADLGPVGFDPTYGAGLVDGPSGC